MPRRSRKSAKIRTLAVTGGTGFVGSHLLHLALAQGYDVRALTRGWKPPEDEIAVPDGLWRDVLRGEERRLNGQVPVRSLLDARGIAVLERA